LELMLAPVSRGPEPAGPNESASPAELIDGVLPRFAGRRLVATTAFGMEGCALIDLLARSGQAVTVAYVDTAFFFDETYALRDRLVERYPGVRFLCVRTELTPEQQAALHGPELWQRDPDLCCKLRKVDPLKPALAQADVWITGLRRGQSSTRAQLRVLEWDWQYWVLKFNPLASWSREQIWDYIRANDVPYNPLHEQGYPTIGCTHCTQPVAGAKVTDYSRDGRWAGQQKTECGLHGYGI
jgi:phosphoadenosine phosphosulfate reductase